MDTGEFTPLLVTLSTTIYFFFCPQYTLAPHPAFAHVQSLAILHDVALAMDDK